LTVERVSKSYGRVRALVDVSCQFLPGEVHAVLGENGAGKSTLMGVLAGFVVPDQGRVLFDSGELPLGKPHAIRRIGVGMVHQHFMLVPEFTVAENFALGTLDELPKKIDLSSVGRRISEVAKELGWEVDPSARTGSLPVGSQQRLEILKALAGNASILILDEPTAVLSPREVEDLFRVIRRLRDDGKCVILIAHKLSEVLAVADRVTVLRRGSVVATAEIAATNVQELATWMVGEVPSAVAKGAELGQIVLEADGVEVLGARGERAVRSVSFTVRQGEIVGIGGVDGNGQNELAEALVRLRPLVNGEIRTIAAKVGYVPQDRQREGLALEMSVVENVLIGDDSIAWAGPFLRSGAIHNHTKNIVEQYDVRVGILSDAVGTMSGGNQQKLLLGRVLTSLGAATSDATEPVLLVVNNPTRGLDLKATSFVQGRILEAARNGVAVVLFSTDLDEIALLSDRTYFMSRGELREGGAEALVG
jgi:simple sugar transport system ATP-binding protein